MELSEDAADGPERRRRTAIGLEQRLAFRPTESRTGFVDGDVVSRYVESGALAVERHEWIDLVGFVPGQRQAFDEAEQRSRVEVARLGAFREEDRAAHG